MKVEALGGLRSGGEVEVGLEAKAGNPMILLLLITSTYYSKIGLLCCPNQDWWLQMYEDKKGILKDWMIIRFTFRLFPIGQWGRVMQSADTYDWKYTRLCCKKWLLQTQTYGTTKGDLIFIKLREQNILLKVSLLCNPTGGRRWGAAQKGKWRVHWIILRMFLIHNMVTY